jgi:hypothetical protein
MLRRHSCKLIVLCLLPAACFFLVPAAEEAQRQDLSAWSKEPMDFKGATVAGGKATLTSERWAWLLAPDEHADGEFAATFTIQEPAKTFRFFGESWSAWPDPTWGDGGFEAAFLLRAGKDRGYRVQVSHRYQEISLVKYPDGGYVQSVPCDVKLKKPQRLTVALSGNQIVVRLDEQEKIRWQDDLSPLDRGRFGVGSSSGAKVDFSDVTILSKPAGPKLAAKAKQTAHLTARQWLGGRRWVFDGNEPIMQLPYQQKHTATYFTQTVDNVKLLPGYRPLLNWNGHWDIANQGAFPEGGSKATEPEVSGGGKTLTITWSARQHDDRFLTRTQLTVGYDAKRGTYTYDVDSELEALTTFTFRYGYDFEHHTPLDPFRWQYLVVRRDQELVHRPVYPVDPGPLYGVAQKDGLRMWYGRHGEKMVVAPAIEYQLPDAGKRKLNTAVCAAFYDTGVSLEPETAQPGTKVKVHYRYTGYPAAEADAIFKASKVYDSFMLDPTHHYIFADEWPKLTFSKFVPLSETWIYGRTPFMTGHNTRPSYELAKDTGVGSGYAMKLGPGAYGKANLPAPKPLLKGRYVVSALVRSDNTHGPGGRIELFALEEKTGKVLRQETHHVGNGTFGWKPIAFVSEVPSGAAGLAVAFGNRGTGDFLIADVEFKRLEEGEAVPPGVLAQANTKEPAWTAAPAGAIADYRMEEGRGGHVFEAARGQPGFDHGRAQFGMLELANVDWVVDEGRPALRFADNRGGRAVYPRAGALDRGYFSHPSYKDKQTVPVAVAGAHGGGFDLKAFTLAAWVKPAAELPDGRGDIVGLGARRCILSLFGRKAPYRLGATINVNDSFVADVKLDAERWYHVAVTAEPAADGKWRVRLYLDGKLVQDGVTKKFEAPEKMTIPPSLILGAELFYMHSSYYRGLIGRTLVYDRALSEEQIAALAAGK